MATVLVADDHRAVRRLLVLSLDHAHTVIEAADGAEALERLRRHRPDIALLDVVMPGLSGLQVCRLLREDPELRGIGVIILSANAREDEARQAGADRFIAKPFSPGHVLATIDDLLRVRTTAIGLTVRS
jgi:CheY-like chemotaxis protein